MGWDEQGNGEAVIDDVQSREPAAFETVDPFTGVVYVIHGLPDLRNILPVLGNQGYPLRGIGGTAQEFIHHALRKAQVQRVQILPRLDTVKQR